MKVNFFNEKTKTSKVLFFTTSNLFRTFCFENNHMRVVDVKGEF